MFYPPSVEAKVQLKVFQFSSIAKEKTMADIVPANRYFAVVNNHIEKVIVLLTSDQITYHCVCISDNLEMGTHFLVKANDLFDSWWDAFYAVLKNLGVPEGTFDTKVPPLKKIAIELDKLNISTEYRNQLVWDCIAHFDFTLEVTGSSVSVRYGGRPYT